MWPTMTAQEVVQQYVRKAANFTARKNGHFPQWIPVCLQEFLYGCGESLGVDSYLIVILGALIQLSSKIPRLTAELVTPIGRPLFESVSQTARAFLPPKQPLTSLPASGKLPGRLPPSGSVPRQR